jgi:hypothetical protein
LITVAAASSSARAACVAGYRDDQQAAGLCARVEAFCTAVSSSPSQNGNGFARRTERQGGVGLALERPTSATTLPTDRLRFASAESSTKLRWG